MSTQKQSIRNYPTCVYLPNNDVLQTLSTLWEVYGTTPLAYTPPETYTTPGSVVKTCVPLYLFERLRYGK